MNVWVGVGRVFYEYVGGVGRVFSPKIPAVNNGEAPLGRLRKTRKGPPERGKGVEEKTGWRAPAVAKIQTFSGNYEAITDTILGSGHG